MKIRTTILATALSLAASHAAMAASLGAVEATDLLERQGYRNVSMLELRNGLWLGTATDRDGRAVKVSVDAARGELVAEPGARTTITTTTTTQPQPSTVVVEKTIEQPAVRRAIVVEEKVLVPVGEKIDKGTVAAVLHGAGYHDVHDIDWLSHRGVWKAEARDPSGDDREVHVDPYDGAIVHVEDD